MIGAAGIGAGAIGALRIPGFRLAYPVRGALVWVGLRLGASLGGLGDASVVVELTMLVAVAAAVYLDARRRREDLFLANLRVPAYSIALAALPLAALLELVVP